MVGEEDQPLTCFRVGDFDSAEFIGIVFGGVEAGEDDSLVALEAGVFVDGVGIEAAIAPVGLGADDEERGAAVEDVETAKVQVAAVHDVEGAGFGQEQVEDLDIVQFAVGDVDKGRDTAAQVKQGMQFDSAFGGAEAGPRGRRRGTGRWWWHRGRRRYYRVPVPGLRRHTGVGRGG